jgi:serine/threonine-protein kinase RsbW
MVDQLEIQLRNDHGELARLAEALEDFLQRHGCGSEVAMKVNLALDELVTNIINYGYDDGGQHIIRLSLSRDGQVLRMVLEDDGKPFNPLEAPTPDLTAPLEDRAIGGLGIHFVREIMDSVTYRRDGGRNLLTMVRKLDPAPTAAGG